MKMKKEIIIVMLILLSSLVSGIVVPRGDAVKVYLISQNPDPIEPGGYVELRFKIENIGADYAKNLIFEIMPEYPFSLDKSISPEKKLGDMYMQQVDEESFVLYYKMRVDKDAIDGNNPIKVKYSTDDGLTWTRSQFDVRIQTTNLIVGINKVAVEPEEISPGKTASITITLENNAESLLRNVNVKLGIVTQTVTSTSVTTTEIPLTPKGSANEKSVGNIGSHDLKNITFDVIADSSAVSKIYKLPLIISYNDVTGKNYTQTYYTSITIGETPDISTLLESSEIISSGSSGKISIKFTNKGTSDIKLLNVELIQSESYEILSTSQVYVGNIDSDDYESADFSLYVKSTRNKAVQLPLRIEYRDSNNKEIKEDIILQLRLFSSSEAKRFGLVKAGSPLSSIIIIAIILGAVWYYFKKKKNINIFRAALNKAISLIKRKN
jgi:hypothetical protein